jgi:ribosomal protein L40E
MSKYLQVIWLYIIGLLVILIGLYLLINNGGPSSFLVMLVGLGIAAVGSAHGRKMKQMGQLDIEQLMKERGFGEQEGADADKEPAQEQLEQPPLPEGKDVPEQSPAAPPAEQSEQAEAEKPPEKVEEKAAEPEEPEVPKGGGLMSIFKRGPDEGELRPDDVMQIELQDIKSGKLAPTEADVIELVCPKCGAENDEKNFYCYTCGNKLRRKPKDALKSKIMVEPGAIAVVGDKRVAKVVVCPKCNAANKETDKFCFNCGKKLRADRLKVVKKKAVKTKSAKLSKKSKSKTF